MLFVSRYTRGCGWPDLLTSRIPHTPSAAPLRENLDSQDARPPCSSSPIDRGVVSLLWCEPYWGFYHGHLQQGRGEGCGHHLGHNRKACIKATATNAGDLSFTCLFFSPQCTDYLYGIFLSAFLPLNKLSCKWKFCEWHSNAFLGSWPW